MEQYYKEFNQYYEYKKKYTAKIEKFKKGIRDLTELSVSEKRGRFKEYTPTCVKCGKSGGTFFSESPTNLKSYCLANPPCEFNVNIIKKSFKRLDDAYRITDAKIKAMKTKLIRTQLNYMFGFDTKEETVMKSTELKLELKPEEKEFNKINSLIKAHIIDNSIIESIQIDIFKAIDDMKNKMDSQDSLNVGGRHDNDVPYNGEIKDKYAEIRDLNKKYIETKYKYYKMEKNNRSGESAEGSEGETEKRPQSQKQTQKSSDDIIYNLVSKPYLYSQMEYEPNH